MYQRRVTLTGTDKPNIQIASFDGKEIGYLEFLEGTPIPDDGLPRIWRGRVRNEVETFKRKALCLHWILETYLNPRN